MKANRIFSALIYSTIIVLFVSCRVSTPLSPALQSRINEKLIADTDTKKLYDSSEKLLKKSEELDQKYSPGLILKNIKTNLNTISKIDADSSLSILELDSISLNVNEIERDLRLLAYYDAGINQKLGEIQAILKALTKKANSLKESANTSSNIIAKPGDSLKELMEKIKTAIEKIETSLESSENSEIPTNSPIANRKFKNLLKYAQKIETHAENIHVYSMDIQKGITGILEYSVKMGSLLGSITIDSNEKSGLKARLDTISLQIGTIKSNWESNKKKDIQYYIRGKMRLVQKGGAPKVTEVSNKGYLDTERLGIQKLRMDRRTKVVFVNEAKIDSCPVPPTCLLVKASPKPKKKDSEVLYFAFYPNPNSEIYELNSIVVKDKNGKMKEGLYTIQNRGQISKAFLKVRWNQWKKSRKVKNNKIKNNKEK